MQNRFPVFSPISIRCLPTEGAENARFFFKEKSADVFFPGNHLHSSAKQLVFSVIGIYYISSSTGGYLSS